MVLRYVQIRSSWHVVTSRDGGHRCRQQQESQRRTSSIGQLDSFRQQPVHRYAERAQAGRQEHDRRAVARLDQWRPLSQSNSAVFDMLTLLLIDQRNNAVEQRPLAGADTRDGEGGGGACARASLVEALEQRSWIDDGGEFDDDEQDAALARRQSDARLQDAVLVLRALWRVPTRRALSLRTSARQSAYVVVAMFLLLDLLTLIN